MKNGKRLPAIFIENRIFLQPKTKTGVTLILITDSAGGRGIMTTKGVEKAGLPKMIEIEEFFTVELPEIVEDHWIPPLVNDGEKAPLLVYDGGKNLMDN